MPLLSFWVSIWEINLVPARHYMYATKRNAILILSDKLRSLSICSLPNDCVGIIPRTKQDMGLLSFLWVGAWSTPYKIITSSYIRSIKRGVTWPIDRFGGTLAGPGRSLVEGSKLLSHEVCNITSYAEDLNKSVEILLNVAIRYTTKDPSAPSVSRPIKGQTSFLEQATKRLWWLWKKCFTCTVNVPIDVSFLCAVEYDGLSVWWG